MRPARLRPWLRRARARARRRRAAPDSWPRSAPIATVWPVGAAISLKTPAPGALTSSVTLSVSSSTSGSSAFTASPGFLNHLPTVASLIEFAERRDSNFNRHGTRAARRPSLILRSDGGDRRQRHAGTHRDRRHRRVFVRKPRAGDDDRIGRLHRLERLLRGGLDDRDAIALRPGRRPDPSPPRRRFRPSASNIPDARASAAPLRTSCPRRSSASAVSACRNNAAWPARSNGDHPVQAKHSSRKAFSCARCFDIRPVAVAADAGRPA